MVTLHSNKILRLAAAAEAATGFALIVSPWLVGSLLLGDDLAGAASAMARIAGMALVGLGIACWSSPLLGMLAYGALITFYLAYLGLAGGFLGALLWPAVAVHSIVTILLGLSWSDRGREQVVAL